MDDETRAYLDEMRRELSGRFGALDGRVATLDGKIDGTRRELEQKIDEARRESGALNEALRRDLQTVIEGVNTGTKKLAAHTQSIERLRDQMNLRFAVVKADLAEVQRAVPRRRRPRR